MFTVDRVARVVKMLGYPVVSQKEPTSLEDGMVVVNDKVHIQVDYNYGFACVVVESEKQVTFLPKRISFDNLIKDINEVMSE